MLIDAKLAVSVIHCVSKPKWYSDKWPNSQTARLYTFRHKAAKICPLV